MEPAGAALTRQQQLFDSHTFSDIIIKFNSNGFDSIYAHKTILSISSAWFFKIFLVDRQVKELRIVTDDKDVMRRLLRHIYGFDVFPAPFPSTIYMDITLLQLADKYGVTTLVEQTQEKIAERLRSMKEKLTWTAATCAIVLDEIYGAPKGDGSLRRLAAEACHSRMADLVAEDKFQETLLKYPEIAADLMKRPAAGLKSEPQESNKRRRV